jgi:hypothetical protein
MTSSCAFSISESHDDNYGITHSSVLVGVVKDISICSRCVGRVLEKAGTMHMTDQWVPTKVQTMRPMARHDK